MNEARSKRVNYTSVEEMCATQTLLQIPYVIDEDVFFIFIFIIIILLLEELPTFKSLTQSIQVLFWSIFPWK